ncbi:hypothetical protein FF38_03924 [Lucilia cuprina]|uniref:Uncharacterized protein n=1 Tax=Lucilia cuprina TaxID=7375 RepID=A0A0L0CDR5_LUCCU|nr:hypothetical protein FF38_03924 [Lucilia cuprina]
MGFSKEPNSSSSDIIKSISTLACIKSPSVERLTVPLMPIKQCSLLLKHRRNYVVRNSLNISSQFQNTLGAPPTVATDGAARAYSSKGGSIKITSNLVPNVLISKCFKSAFKYMGAEAVSCISLSLSLISSLNFGYSSKRSAKPTSRIKFCGL